MASSKHFPVKKYILAPDFSGADIPCTKMLLGRTDSPLENETQVTTAIYQQHTSDPYATVTSFKCYDRSDLPAANDGVKVVSKQTHPDNHLQYLDDTIVSAYETTKPPLPGKPIVARQPSFQGSVHNKDKQNISEFSPGRLNMQKGYDANTDIRHDYSQSDSLVSYIFNKVNLPSKLKPDPVLNINDQCHRDMYKESSEDSDSLSSASLDAKRMGDNSRPSSAGRRRLPIVPQSTLRSSLNRHGSSGGDQNALCAKEEGFDKTSVTSDLDETVTKLSEIIENVKKSKDVREMTDCTNTFSEKDIEDNNLNVHDIQNSCDIGVDKKYEKIDENEITEFNQSSDSDKNHRESKKGCVKTDKSDSKQVGNALKVNSLKDKNVKDSGKTNNTIKASYLNGPVFDIRKNESIVSDPSQQYLKEMARKVKSKLATKLAEAEIGESLGQTEHSRSQNNERRKDIHSANEVTTFEDELVTADQFFKFDADVIQELTDSVMMKNAKVKDDVLRNNKTSEIMVDKLDKSLSKSEDKEELVYKEPELRSKESLEGKSVFEKHVKGKSTKSDNKEINDKDSFGSGDKQSLPNKPKVERTPSYKNRVISRAKNKYLKKSTMHKECSCQNDENGVRIVCQFCVLYEHKKRSKSSLGNVSINKIGEQDEDDNCVIKSPRRAVTPGGLSAMSSGKSPRPVKKVHVSSRVDVLMSTDLFRKHLQKHEDLLHRHTKFQRAGMRKSVSNLDLTTGFVGDSDSESVLSFVNVDIDDVQGTEEGEKNANRNVNKFSQMSANDTTEKVPSKSVSAVEEITNRAGKKKSASRTLPKTVGKSRLPFTCMNNQTGTSKYSIPTLDEFKKLKTSPAHGLGLDDKDQVDWNDENNSQKQIDLSETVAECKHSDSECTDCGNNKTAETLYSQSHLADDNCKQSNRAQDFKHVASCDAAKQIEWEPDEVAEVKHVPKESTKASVDTDSQGVELQPTKNSKTIECDGRLQTAPSMRLKQRVRPKLKSRTLSRLELESETIQSFPDPNEPSGVSARERRKPGIKRPRSLISKKSSLLKLLQEQEHASNGSEVLDSGEKSIQDRPKLKVAHSVGRSKSDTKFETDRSKISIKSAFRCEPSSSENNGFVHFKGKNSVSFDLEDESRCSPFDIGESETSTSVAGSLSDSIRSELIADEQGDLLVDADHAEKPLSHSNQDGGNLTSSLTGTEHMAPVGRSTSDACKITLEAARKRRERKERPYKSDPFSGTEIIPAAKRCALREERERLGHHQVSSTGTADKIFSFLDDLRPGESYPSLEELQEGREQFSPLTTAISNNVEQLCKVRKNPSNVSSLSTDSGVIGQDGSHDSQQSSPTNTLSHSLSDRNMSAWQHNVPRRSLSVSCGDLTSGLANTCPECNRADLVATETRCPPFQLCTQCCQWRLERKKTIQEVMETEVNYGRDLTLLKEEFYLPMLKAGLLTQDQLDAIFLNLDELIHVNGHFVTKLRSAINSASANSDNDLQEVMIGSLFLESSTMFLTFENYCVNQSQVPVLLEQYERDKELVRIFLQALQNDNQQLRRMHLKSFLMVPVQRIMKYPLLLDRLYRNTPSCHSDKLALREAKNKIEDILGHINARSQTTIISRQRKASSVRKTSCSVSVKIEVSRVALETLRWKRKDVCDVITSQLLITQPLDHLWAVKRCKNYKFTTVYGVLMTLSETMNENDPQLKDSNVINDNNNSQVKSAAVVFIREKSGRFQVFQEPFMLDKCIVSQDPDFLEVFEILEWNKDAFIVKAETTHETKLWLQHLRQQMNRLGNWRKRRNAMPNILLNHNH